MLRGRGVKADPMLTVEPRYPVVNSPLEATSAGGLSKKLTTQVVLTATHTDVQDTTLSRPRPVPRKVLYPLRLSRLVVKAAVGGRARNPAQIDKERSREDPVHHTAGVGRELAKMTVRGRSNALLNVEGKEVL